MQSSGSCAPARSEAHARACRIAASPRSLAPSHPQHCAGHRNPGRAALLQRTFLSRSRVTSAPMSKRCLSRVPSCRASRRFLIDTRIDAVAAPLELAIHHRVTSTKDRSHDPRARPIAFFTLRLRRHLLRHATRLGHSASPVRIEDRKAACWAALVLSSLLALDAVCRRGEATLRCYGRRGERPACMRTCVCTLVQRPRCCWVRVRRRGRRFGAASSVGISIDQGQGRPCV